MPVSASSSASADATWIQGLLTLGVWALVGASVLAWGLRWWPQAPASEAKAPLLRSQEAADIAAIARALGADTEGRNAEPASAMPSRAWRLVGVVADASHQGVALIAVDNAPARPVRVGAPVGAGLVLQSVNARQAVLAQTLQGPAVQTLSLRPEPAREPAEGAAAQPPGLGAAPLWPR